MRFAIGFLSNVSLGVPLLPIAFLFSFILRAINGPLSIWTILIRGVAGFHQSLPDDTVWRASTNGSIPNARGLLTVVQGRFQELLVTKKRVSFTIVYILRYKGASNYFISQSLRYQRLMKKIKKYLKKSWFSPCQTKKAFYICTRLQNER